MRRLLVMDSARTFADNPVTFVDDVPATVLCVACGNISSELFCDPGGHLYCQPCLARMNNDGAMECCVDKATHMIQDMKKRTDSFLDALDLRAICPKNACTYQATLREVMDHYGKCNVRKVQCPLCHRNLNIKSMGLHLTDDCEMRLLQCRYCNLDVEACRLKNHVDICDERPATCSHCKKEFSKYAELRDQHLEVCPLKPVKCPYTPLGCEFQATESDMIKHAGTCKHRISIVSRLLDLEQKLLGVQEENDQLKKITSETQGALRELRAENEELRNVISEKEAEFRDTRTSLLETVTRLNEDTKARLHSVEEMTNRLNEELLSAEKHELRGAKCKTGKQASLTDPTEHARQLNDALSKICDLEKEIAKLKQAAAKIKEDTDLLNAAVPTIQGDIRNVQIWCEQRNLKSEKTASSLVESHTSLQETMSLLNEDTKAHQQSHAGQLNDALSKICDLEKEIAELKQAAAKIKEDTDLLNAAVPTIQGDMRSVQIQCELRILKSEKTVSSLVESHTSLQETMSLLNEDTKAHQQSVEEMVKNMTGKLSLDVHRLQQQNNWLHDAFNKLSAEVEKMKSDLREFLQNFFAAQDDTKKGKKGPYRH